MIRNETTTENEWMKEKKQSWNLIGCLSIFSHYFQCLVFRVCSVQALAHFTPLNIFPISSAFDGFSCRWIWNNTKMLIMSIPKSKEKKITLLIANRLLDWWPIPKTDSPHIDRPSKWDLVFHSFPFSVLLRVFVIRSHENFKTNEEEKKYQQLKAIMKLEIIIIIIRTHTQTPEHQISKNRNPVNNERWTLSTVNTEHTTQSLLSEYFFLFFIISKRVRNLLCLFGFYSVRIICKRKKAVQSIVKDGDLLKAITKIER